MKDDRTGDLFSRREPPKRIVPNDPPAARAARDDGIKRAVNRADAESPSWSDVALMYIERFAKMHATLTAEEVRDFAYKRGLPKPANERAWGGPFRRAVEAKIVTHGTMERATDPKVHCSYMMRWRSLLCSQSS